jgi:uncharacterized protein (DUF58 family)
MPISPDPGLQQRLGRLEFLARQAVEGFITGLHKSPFHGFSVEFAEHRLYNPGESTRHIDWKLFARTDRMFVKRYEEETNLRCQLVIDRSSSMRYPEGAELTKLGFAVNASAALIELFRRQRDAVGMSWFDTGLDLHLPAKSSHAHHRLLYHHLDELLDGVDSEPVSTSTAAALHQIAESIPRRSLVMIFSDMLDRDDAEGEALLTALQHLRHNKHEVVVFHVLDGATEASFDFEDRPTLFTDLETGEELRLHPSEVREAYRSSMSALRSNLELRCAQYGIDLVDVDIAEGVGPVLTSYLVKRKRMNA